MSNEKLIVFAREQAFWHWGSGNKAVSVLLDEMANALEDCNCPEIPDSSVEWGVQYTDSTGEDHPIWLAEDEHEAFYEATNFDGKIMKRIVGPWEESK